MSTHVTHCHRVSRFAVVFHDLLWCFWICCCISGFAVMFPDLLRCFQIYCHVSGFAFVFPNLLSCFWIYCCDFGLITFLIFALMVGVGNLIKNIIWWSNHLLPVIFWNCTKSTNNTYNISESILWCNLSWYCYHLIILPRPKLPYSKPLLCLACGSELKCFQDYKGVDTHNTNSWAAKSPNWDWVTGLAEWNFQPADGLRLQLNL